MPLRVGILSTPISFNSCIKLIKLPVVLLHCSYWYELTASSTHVKKSVLLT